MNFIGKTVFCSALLVSGIPLFSAGESVIIDHTCTDIDKVPAKFIEKAKSEFKMSYGHTSHGSQIVSGMEAMRDKDSLFGFARESKGNKKILSLWDYTPAGDLGNPDRTTWAERTREFLKGPGKDRNIVMWSWCGQAGTAKESDIDDYLKLMSGLEKEFPKVKFVYMTGHLNGSGKDGNLNKRNEQIREFCRKHGKILFDFADIESYAPGGDVNYMELKCTDGCDYKQKDGSTANWADEWLAANPDSGIALPAKAAHSKPLNAALKGRAFWWMLACLSGWEPNAEKGKTPIKNKGSKKTKK